MGNTKQVSKNQKTYNKNKEIDLNVEYKIQNNSESWKGLTERAWYQFKDEVGIKKFTIDIGSILGLWLAIVFSSIISSSMFSLIVLGVVTIIINQVLYSIHKFNMIYIFTIALGIGFVVAPILSIVSFFTLSTVYELIKMYKRK